MSKERPILFSAPMVRAILDGQKTQTRRVIKGVPRGMHYSKDIMDWDLSGIHQAEEDDPFGYPEKKGSFYLEVQTDVDDNSHDEIFCPHGKPGDRLWVRETWCEGYPGTADPVLYRASYEGGADHKWRPSIFMPRKYSRITLEVVDVRVERIQQITTGGLMQKSDVQKEGCPFRNDPAKMGEDEGEWFISLWDSINAKRGFSFDSNPWVWVIEFKLFDRSDSGSR